MDSALRFLVHTKEGDIYPDLILLDLAMPVMDGIEFLEFYSRLAISGKDKIRIIAMWSPGKIKDTKRAQELGIEEFWIKHQIETKLKEVIEKLS